MAAPSASLYNASTGFDYRGDGASWFVGGMGHVEMAGDSQIISDVLDFFHAGPTGLASTAVEGQAGADAPSARGSAPQELSGLEVVARGPVETHVEDSAGRQMAARAPSMGESGDDGAVPGQNARIPGASALRGAASQSAFVTQQDSYVTTWTATEPGEVNVRLHHYDSDEVVATVAYPAVALQEGGTVTVAHDAAIGGQPPRLLVDTDGDGRVDSRVRAASRVDGEAAKDREAPRSSASVRSLGAGESANVAVTLEAQDAGLAGVDRIEYAVEATGETGVYQGGRLVLPAEGELRVRAVDRAGNVEAPALVVDLAER